jgi:GGDEF domain-containing protein
MAVISLRKSVSDLDRLAGERAAFQEALAHCIESAGQYAVELRQNGADTLRVNLHRIAEQAATVSDRHGLDLLHADLRGELRQYRDRAQSEVTELKQQVASAVSSVQEFIATVSLTDGEQEKTLAREFQALEATAETGDLTAIRSAIHETVDSALRGFEEIRRAREVTIAQLQDEIRSLHREVEHERRAAHEDPATHLWNRAKLDARIQDLVLLNETFCVFIIGIRNLTQLGARDSRLPSDCMRAFAKRLTNLVAQSGEIGMVGRWSEDCVAIVFNLPLAGAPLPMEQLHATLGGAYSIQLDGVSHTVQLALRIQPIERPKGSNEGAFYLSLGQAAFSVTAH